MTTTTAQRVDVSQLDKKAIHIYDVYRRARGVYERAEIAMGRVQRYRVTMGSATGVKIGDERNTP